MTQYLLAVYGDESEMAGISAEEMQRLYQQVEVFNTEVKEAGAWVFAGVLQPTGTAIVVRDADGKAVTAEGPYIETREQLGGFWIIEASDLDGALEWAAKGSAACKGPVEVRAFQDEQA
jgi:hypothetical protein